MRKILCLLVLLGGFSTQAQTAYAEIYKQHWYAEQDEGLSNPPVERSQEQYDWSLDGSLAITRRQEYLWDYNTIGPLCLILREDDTHFWQWQGPYSDQLTDWARCNTTYVYNHPYHTDPNGSAVNSYCFTGYHAAYVNVIDAFTANLFNTRLCDQRYRVRMTGGGTPGSLWRVRIAFNIDRINVYPGPDGHGCDPWSYLGVNHFTPQTTTWYVGTTGIRILNDGTAYVNVPNEGWIDVHPNTPDGYWSAHFRYQVTVMSVLSEK